MSAEKLDKVLYVLGHVHPPENTNQWERIRVTIAESSTHTPAERLKEALEVLEGTMTEKNKDQWAHIRATSKQILAANHGFEEGVAALCHLLAGIHPTDANFEEWAQIRAAASS